MNIRQRARAATGHPQHARTRRSRLSAGSPLEEWLLALTGGALLGIAFLWTYGWILAVLAYAPFFVLVARAHSPRVAVAKAFVGFLVATATSLHWVAYHPFPGTAAASLLALPYLALVAALPVAPAVWIAHGVGRTAGSLALLTGILVAEWWLTAGPLPFPWLLAGHTQAMGPVAPSARFGGVPGLSLWVLSLNVVGAHAILGGSRAASLLAPALALGGLGLGAALPWTSPEAAAPHPSMVVGLVQPAVEPLTWADSAAVARPQILHTLTDSLLATAGPVDLLIWPETAVWRSQQPAPPTFAAPLLTGAIERTEGAWRNQAVLVPRADSGALASQLDVAPQQYLKQHLVPFAEAVPFADRWPWLHRLAVPSGGVSNYAQGDAVTLLRTDALDLGALICFESVFGNTARRMVEEGAEVLVVLAQNGWWGASVGAVQHRAYSRLRVFETGRPVVYAAVAGGSTVWDTAGRPLVALGWMERRAVVESIPLTPVPTPYFRYGDLVSPAALVLWLLLAGWAGRQHFRPRPALA